MSNQKNVIKSWKDLKEQKKTAEVDLVFPGGDTVFVTVQGLSQAKIDGIQEMYDEKKPAKPTKVVPGKPGVAPKTIEVSEGKEYDEWVKQCNAIDSLRFAHLALEFMVVKPEGTFEEQIKALKEDLLSGHYQRIIMKGYEISGYNLDDNIEKAKNS